MQARHMDSMLYVWEIMCGLSSDALGLTLDELSRSHMGLYTENQLYLANGASWTYGFSLTCIQNRI